MAKQGLGDIRKRQKLQRAIKDRNLWRAIIGNVLGDSAYRKRRFFFFFFFKTTHKLLFYNQWEGAVEKCSPLVAIYVKTLPDWMLRTCSLSNNFENVDVDDQPSFKMDVDPYSELWPATSSFSEQTLPPWRLTNPYHSASCLYWPFTKQRVLRVHNLEWWTGFIQGQYDQTLSHKHRRLLN